MNRATREDARPARGNAQQVRDARLVDGNEGVEYSGDKDSPARVLREAARRGIGIAVLPEFLVIDDVRKGDLVSLLPETPIPQFWLKAIVPRIKLAKPAVHELVQYLKKRMQPTPPWEGANSA